MTSRQRAALAETLLELANLAAGAMVLSQFVGERPLSIRAIVPGVLIWLTFVALALPLTKEGRGG